MRRALLVLCCTSVCGVSLAAPAAAIPDPPPHLPPVDAPVLDPFRPPATPYGAGNRGLEYATPEGTPVRATADGLVTFAGPVAASLHVTVLHDDGVRTTYSFLARIDVVVGQRIEQSDVVGITAGALHLGARRGSGYFDPASLFDHRPPQVRLVPFDEPLGDGAAGERSAVSQLIGGIGGLLDRAGGVVGATAGWLRDDPVQLLRTMGHYASRFTFPTSVVDAALTTWQAWQRARQASGRPCTAAGVRPHTPPERRVAILVAGLGSDSRASTVDEIDARQLGYAPPDVLRFSYAGGRVPDDTDGLTAIPASAYGAADSQTDLRVTGRRLADLVEVVALQAPGLPIDLYAHSLGGVVTRLALLELERRHGVAWLHRLGLVATLGTPHGGADLATAVHAMSATDSGQDVLGIVGQVTHPDLEPAAIAVRQLAETSDVVAELADHPVPDGVDAVSIAARGDVIVPVPRSVAPGMAEVVVPLTGPSAHSDLPGSAAATRELALALAGLPPGCQSFRAALLDQAVGEGISLLEDLVGTAGFVTAARADVRAA